MRWDNLFDDLEGQLEQELDAEELDLQAEEERLRLGRLSLRDRLLAIHETDPGASIRLVLADGDTLSVHPATIGRDWMSGDLLDGSTRRAQCLLPVAAISSLLLTPEQVTDSLEATDAAASDHGLSGRLGLGFVLRDLCRRRRAVDLRLAGTTPGGVTLHGTIDRVGRDHLDIAVHEADSPRRRTAVTQYRVVPLAQLLVVRL
ncbi:MAG TPA: hypothetical protein VGC18_05955 [Lacisediminihabitans sp.]|uniref:hypothetical protein n=1 Tax=Lacisediminihabitans sp. TaxID=2787631 RepID=UPI002ED8915D